LPGDGCTAVEHQRRPSPDRRARDGYMEIPSPQWTGDARIRASVFAGQDRTQILDTQEITSYLPTAVDEVIAFVQRNTRRAILVTGIRNEGVPEIPLIALREAVINAVVHADYGQHGSPLRVAVFSDRLEIENPGGLPPGLTLDEDWYRHGTTLRATLSPPGSMSRRKQGTSPKRAAEPLRKVPH